MFGGMYECVGNCLGFLTQMRTPHISTSYIIATRPSDLDPHMFLYVPVAMFLENVAKHSITAA